MKYEKIRKIVLEAIQEAVAEGLVKGTSGNIALRDDEDDVVAITPSGISYTGMTAEDIAIVDLNGKWLDGPYKPSSEVPMHTAVMRARPDVKATVHTHAMFATIMAMGDCPELRPITPPQCGKAVLIKNHGMFCCGKNMKQAMHAATYTEEMALTTFYSKLLGVYEPMSEEAEAAMKALIAADQAV